MIGVRALSRSNRRSYWGGSQASKRQSLTRFSRWHRVQMGAFAVFMRALNLAPSSKPGRLVFKWDFDGRDYDFSTFNPAYLTSADIQRPDLDLVRHYEILNFEFFCFLHFFFLFKIFLLVVYFW